MWVETIDDPEPAGEGDGGPGVRGMHWGAMAASTWSKKCHVINVMDHVMDYGIGHVM